MLREASTTVKMYFASDALVKLHNRRKETLGYFPIPLKPEAMVREPTPLERAQTFVKAATFARNMENQVVRHYNFDQQAKEKPQEKNVGSNENKGRYHEYEFKKEAKVLYEEMEIRCDGCKTLDHMECPLKVLREYGQPSDSVFVRLSYRSMQGQKNRLIWEGFVPHCKNKHYQDRRDYGEEPTDEYEKASIDLSSVIDAMDWSELKEYIRLLDSDPTDQEKALHLEKIAASIQAVVILLPNPPGMEKTFQVRLWSTGDQREEVGTYLIVGTGGFDRYSCGTVHLKPRNTRMHEKVWNPNNFLETSISIGKGTNVRLNIMNDNPIEYSR